jgi:hypothetical protein
MNQSTGNNSIPVTPGCSEQATQEQLDARHQALVKAFRKGNKNKESVYVCYKPFSGRRIMTAKPSIFRAKEYTTIIDKMKCLYVEANGKVCDAVLGSSSGNSQSPSSCRKHSITHDLDPVDWTQRARKINQTFFMPSQTGFVMPVSFF